LGAVDVVVVVVHGGCGKNDVVQSVLLCQCDIFIKETW